MGEGDLDFDWSLFSGNESPSGIDLSGLEDMGLTGVGDLADLNFDGADLSNIDLSQLGEMGLTGVDGFDLSSIMEGVGDFDQAAPPSNISELLSSMNANSLENLANTDWEALAKEGLTDEQIAKRDELMSYGKDRIQDFGGADVMQYFDEYDKNMTDIMQNKGGFTSQWQDVGGNKVMINDDPVGGSTATVFNPTTGQTSYLTEEQTKALIDNGTLNTKGSGYVAATGGTGYVPGGGKTYVNADGTKTVITTEGKVLTVTKDGQVIDTGKTVNVNDKTLETKTIKEIINNTKTIGGGGGGSKAAGKSDNNMLLMLLALMAMMNKGGGGSSTSSAVIPSLSADRKQLPYGPAAGSTARPGAGGVTYFSPTTYSPKAAGGGLMSLAGSGVTKMAIGGPTKAALEQAYAAQDYDTVNKLVAQNKITDADVRGTWGMDTSGLSGLGINLYQPPAIPNNNALNAQANPVDTEIFDYFTKNQNLVQNKDYNTIASDMYTSGWTPDMVARATGTDAKSVGDLYNQTYGAFDRAKQEDLVNQKYKKQLGLTDEQLGQRDFGAAMDTRENRLASAPFSNAYEKYQEELAATGRRDAPVGSQFRAKAVYMPDSIGNRGSIQLIDSATGQQLTNFGANDIGNTRNAFELLDKFGVDPASYRNAASQMYESLGKPIYMRDDYDYLTKYKPRDVSGATSAFLTKPLANVTYADLKPKYEKDDNARQTADSKTNVFYEVPMTKLLQSKGLTSTEASNLLGQLRPVAGLVNFAEITRSKDPVKALIGTLNYLQSKGLTNRRFASGGISSLGAASQMSDLGGYSDGGRLLKGPGDGVSDSIPATIGGKQPARLAEGEFVVPARIVSELGNGSTDAGAQKLYAMMDRVQKARRKTKNVAADTKAHKYLPA